MPIHFTYIEDALTTQTIDSLLLPELDICSDQSDTFSMTKLQCAGNIQADMNTGPCPVDSSHLTLCKLTIEKSIQNSSDILITPEYSIPLELVTSIVSNPALQPKAKKIFCLCCEAVSVEQFNRLMTNWEGYGAIVVKSALNVDIHEKNFMNVLIYVFKLGNDRLCLVPQLKTKHMADRFLRCEGAGLTIGSTIYVFGKNSPNQFCSLICADSLHGEINRQCFLPRGNEHVIVFHPQLNPQPRQSAFASLRKQFYDFANGSRIVYITANWAAGTVAREVGSGETIEFNNPWSCIYVKNDKNNWYSSLHPLIQQNHCYGIGFTYWQSHWVNIWYSFKEENIQVVHVKKPNPTGACVLQPPEVVGIATYIPSSDRSNWVQYNSCFDETLPDLLLSLTSAFKYPHNIPLDQKDRFFGLCFAHFEEGQLCANEFEVCPRLGMYIDLECQHERTVYARNFLGLVNCLVMTPPFENSPFTFGLSSTYPKYNIFPVPRRDDRGMLATYVEYDFDVKKTMLQLQRNLQYAEYKRTLIFTHDSLKRAPKVFRVTLDKRVGASERKPSITSIVRGGGYA